MIFEDIKREIKVAMIIAELNADYERVAYCEMILGEIYISEKEMQKYNKNFFSDEKIWRDCNKSISVDMDQLLDYRKNIEMED